jgi:hypothetical protein
MGTITWIVLSVAADPPGGAAMSANSLLHHAHSKVRR